MRGALELAEGTGPHYESANTAKLHRKLVRERQGISYDRRRFEALVFTYLAEQIMRFGTYATTELTVRPDAFDPHVDVEFEAEKEQPAAA